MTARLVEANDLANIKQWALTGWDTEYSEDLFPAMGLIVDDIAAVFIYRTDSKVCFIENMVSNREACPVEKDRALDVLLKDAFSMAKDLGFKVAYATTNNPKVISRAIHHGVQIDIKHTLLTKYLTDPS